MSFPASFSPFYHRNGLVKARVVIASSVVGVVLALSGSPTWAQSSLSTPVSQAKPAPQAFMVVSDGPEWQDLSPAQRKTLQPLNSTWGALPAERKSKWIALAEKYPSMKAADQEKFQSRMAEWAALNPKDRERARLNFAKTKKLSPTERNADWETYQALSPEEKKRLAGRAAIAPPGAAVAVKPVDPTKLMAVPLTRRTSEQKATTNVAKPQLDRNTLLPRHVAPTAPAPAPAPLPAPAPGN